MKKLLFSFAAFFLVAAHASDTSIAPPRDESDKAKFVRLTTQLEQDPLGDPDQSIRTWLLEWATKSKDISVTVCDVLGPIPKQDLPYGPDLLTQYLFGNAAFQIANADRRSDGVATQLAGIRSAMRAYSAILARAPDARIPYFDDLLVREQGGTLEAHLKPIIADKCK